MAGRYKCSGRLYIYIYQTYFILNLKYNNIKHDFYTHMIIIYPNQDIFITHNEQTKIIFYH
jgi:hypothetical protein